LPAFAPSVRLAADSTSIVTNRNDGGKRGKDAAAKAGKGAGIAYEPGAKKAERIRKAGVRRKDRRAGVGGPRQARRQPPRPAEDPEKLAFEQPAEIT